MIEKFLSDIITETAERYNKVMPLKSICLTRSIMKADERSFFIRPGDKVKIKDGHLVDCFDGVPTHAIKDCSGTLANTKFSITATDLKTKKQITIKL